MFNGLLAISHVGHIAYVDLEDCLEQDLHGDDHELHVVSHQDLCGESIHCKETRSLSLCLSDGSLLWSTLSRDFMDVPGQPLHSVLSEARSFNFFAVRHLTLQREAKGAAYANFSIDPDFSA